MVGWSNRNSQSTRRREEFRTWWDSLSDVERFEYDQAQEKVDRQFFAIGFFVLSMVAGSLFLYASQ